MRESVRRRYEALADAGELEPDRVQRALADRLDAVNAELAEHACRSKKSALGWLFARGDKPAAPRGLYVWGGVGRGKTLLMDLFFGAAVTPEKRRVHFHAFMAEVHDRIAGFRQRLKMGEVRGDDPIGPVAAEIAADACLLCFDEFSVTDIADAMILGRLFEQLFARGVTIVATSNVAPEDLYAGGLNRALFLPFLERLRERMPVFHLDAPRDYRLDDDGAGQCYVTPLGPAADACLDAHFRRLTGLPKGTPGELAHKGRKIRVPEAADGVARFTFAELCGKPLGAADYGKIAARFHTVILAGIPVFGPEHRNEAKRFINLIDTFYDQHIRLIASAAAEPEALWRGPDAGTETFEFARTASRLIEMRSDAWWEDGSAVDAIADKKKARAH